MFKQALIAASTLLFAAAIATPSASGQFKMSQKIGSPNPAFTLVASKQQCLNKCIKWNKGCQDIVTNEGDKSGWDDNTRRAAYAQHCTPHVDACQNRCGPFGPAECRIMDGEEVCS